MMIRFYFRFESALYFTFRGYCEGLSSNIIDAIYSLDAGTLKVNVDEGIQFLGMTKSKIYLDEKTSRWTVVSLDDGLIMLSLNIEVNTYMFLQQAYIKAFSKNFPRVY